MADQSQASDGTPILVPADDGGTWVLVEDNYAEPVVCTLPPPAPTATVQTGVLAVVEENLPLIAVAGIAGSLFLYGFAGRR